jgi:signal transduction histidine kinase
MVGKWNPRRLTSLLRLNNALIIMMSRLHRAAEIQDADLFKGEAGRLLNKFQTDARNNTTNLEEFARQSDYHYVLVGSIRSMLDNLPARISFFIRLAEANDWTALHARLRSQEDNTDDVVAALMEQADTDLAAARKRLTDDLERAQRRAFNLLACTGLLSLVAAAILGAIVTRTIAKPLVDLDAGTSALAEGNFYHRVPVSGNDELAHLAATFNHTAAELQRLFEEVRRERTNAESANAALKQHAQELARANADLQQFAYSASHDLQEPLRIVALYSQLLHRKYSEQMDADAEEYLGHILRGARHLEALIRDLLAYTKTSSAGDHLASLTDANAVLARVLQILELQISEHECQVTADALPKVMAHEIHVQQLFQNLIANAIRYRGELAPRIHVTAEQKGSQWTFAVSDNGIGIDPKYAKQIFGIFKRLHGQKYPGTGIGLAICQKIVEGYGGSIWVESQLGRGARFRFTLPAAQSTRSASGGGTA